MFALFILHHVLNWRWWAGLFKGRYNADRVLQAAVNVLTLAAMAGLMVSGVILSSKVFAFLPIRGHMAFARRLHMAASHWGFLLMMAHLGLHWGTLLRMARKTGKARPADSEAVSESAPVVFMTTDLSSDGLIAIYNALSAEPSGHIAVKLSTGEPGSNYLRTDLIGPLIQLLNDPTIVECNTAYGGSRSNTAMHYQLAEDHGYTAIAKVDIMDENGSITLPVEGGSNLTENYVGANFANYDYFIVLSHFKGHAMAGFGGAIKNISIGIASAQGESHIH